MEQQSWRTGISQDSRNKILSKIMDTLQRHMPLEGQDGVKELLKIARQFEEEVYCTASNQHDYLRKISLAILNMETQTQNVTSSTSATGLSGTTRGPVWPSVDAVGIAQGQSWQQVGELIPARVLNNGVQGSAGGPASSFSSINNVAQPLPTNAGSIDRYQSRQQAVQPTPAGVLNSRPQGSAIASMASFSSINNGPNQGPVRPLMDSGNIVQAQSRQQRIQQRQASSKQIQSLQPQPTQPLLQQPQQPGFQQQPLAQGGPGDSLQQVSQAGGIDEADKVWSKMQMLKEEYLQDMKDLLSMLTTRSQQHMPQEQLQKLMHYRTVLQRMIPYLVAPKEGLPKEFKQDKVEAFEKQIVSIMETFKRHKQRQPQQGNLDPSSAAGQQPQQAAQISRQQSMGVAAQPTPLNSLANTSTNALHRGNMASYGQNTAVNPLQTKLLTTQQQQRLDKEYESLTRMFAHWFRRFFGRFCGWWGV